MRIRDESPSDSAHIRAVVSAAFGRTEEAGLVDSLRSSGYAEISLVCEEHEQIVGHVLLSRLTLPQGCLALAPVSVRPDRQRSGIGSALIIEALASARTAGWIGVFVLGNPNYYTRFGFRIEATAPFETHYPRPAFMALALKPNGFGVLAGPVEYPTPFRGL